MLFFYVYCYNSKKIVHIYSILTQIESVHPDFEFDHIPRLRIFAAMLLREYPSSSHFSLCFFKNADKIDDF